MGQGFSVGVDFHTWDGIFQGSRSHILGIYKAAIRQRPDVRFCFFLQELASLRAAHPEFSLPNVTLVRMPSWPGALRLALQLPWLQWRHGIDLLHVQYRIPPLNVGRTASTMHDVLFESFPQYFSPAFVRQSRLSFRHSARHADVLLTVSDYSRREIARSMGVRLEDITVTPNGVDFRRFHPGPEGADLVRGRVSGDYILSVGRLEPRKNHAALVDAWSGLGPDAPPLVLVGQRDFRFDDVFQAVARSPRPADVHILEDVDDAGVAAFMRHARAFAYVPFAEGFGMPVLEAMASGVPVVTSNTTSLPEVAGDGAVLVDPADVASIRQGLVQVLSDRALADELRVRGLAQARRFDWEQSARVMMERFEQAVG